jgi:hypothetical protein
MINKAIHDVEKAAYEKKYGKIWRKTEEVK